MKAKKALENLLRLVETKELEIEQIGMSNTLGLAEKMQFPIKDKQSFTIEIECKGSTKAIMEAFNDTKMG